MHQTVLLGRCWWLALLVVFWTTQECFGYNSCNGTILSAAREPIRIPISVYILDSDDDDDGQSSSRTTKEVQDIFVQVNRTWNQADITIDVVAMDRVEVPEDLLRGIGRRDFQSFFQAINRGEVDLGPGRRDGLIWGFCVGTLRGANGMKPNGVNSFFVSDESFVNDFRVTSHEIGHVLRLHHAPDESQLMYSGSNGVFLTQEEQVVARYAAEGMLRFFN